MSAAASSSLAHLRMLIVDDEPFVAEHLQMLLEDAGCFVVGSVGTVDKALAAVGREQLHGVLLDANLHGLSSAPIADALQALGIPFVVVTGYGESELGTAALNNAPRLSKPFNNAQFETALAAAFLR